MFYSQSVKLSFFSALTMYSFPRSSKAKGQRSPQQQCLDHEALDDPMLDKGAELGSRGDVHGC